LFVISNRGHSRKGFNNSLYKGFIVDYCSQDIHSEIDSNKISAAYFKL